MTLLLIMNLDFAWGTNTAPPTVAPSEDANIQIGYIVNMGNQGPTIGGM